MGDFPSRSANANAGGPGVTSRHAGSAGPGVPPIPPDDRLGNRPPLGGGGALPTKARFSMESGFRGLSTAAGAMVLVIIVAIAIFLVSKAVPALSANTENFLTYKAWFPNEAEPRFGIAALAFGTLLSSVIALLVAVPIALAIALFLSHYAPKRLATPLGFVIDLLAAVPSVVFGLWGRDVFSQPVQDFSVWLNKYFGWLPVFGGDGPFGRSILLGSLVLAIMVLPIVTSLSREVFQQTPGMNEEAALALGATKWEMIRTAVLPYGKPGVIAAVMLGLGRALGETIALALTLGTTFTISFNIIQSGGNSIAANIANTFGEANATGRGALIASGLVLFAITLVVNMAARAIIYRRREFRDSAA
ncbi:phosphate transport system permease protein [Actinoplanes sp. NBRC 14428]|uniref:Phosphate transport system permease protein n=1 Tax=Pseudosporangium ferrugineum TaxID=439699 RepID=A0A2T0S5R8_9ACTN|nr:phosphate ABC transporter permease subunit PstC [Pseudosporangium ferrugineum]PRY28781.1 phosphate ABC transporter membrane protein 1 (PhoT family) [Pseudosporangium ferrugineum]BCJ53757.1 phosphate transport system permease protein [Actinoplanes sp. NBRC 14428]